MTTPSNGARTLVFSSASCVTRTRARAETIAASTDFMRAADTSDVGFRRGERGGGGDALFRQLTLPLHLPDVLGVSGGRLGDLCLGFGDRGFGRHQLRVQIGVLDLRDDLPAPHSRAFFEVQGLQPPAGLDADVAAAPRHDVAGRHQHGHRRRAAAAGHGDLRGPHDLDLGRALLVVVLAR